MKSNDYVSFEVAKLLKEKGYNEYCDRFFAKIYDHKEVLTTLTVYDSLSYKELEEGDILRPSLWDVQKWLREKYNIAVNADCTFYDYDGNVFNNTKYYYTIYNIRNEESFQRQVAEYINSYEEIFFDSYEEALLKGIEESLKLI